MEIGKDDLVFTDHGRFRGLRFLDLEDHLRVGPDFGRGVQDPASGFGVLRIRKAAAFAGTALHQDGVPTVAEGFHPGGGQGDPVLVNFNFLNNTNLHG